jgi:hypothetical protein
LVTIAGCAAMPPPLRADERASPAPGGRLRVGSHPGSPTTGVTIDVGRTLTAPLGVDVDVVVNSQTELPEAVAPGRVDVSGTNVSPAARRVGSAKGRAATDRASWGSMPRGAGARHNVGRIPSAVPVTPSCPACPPR